MKETDDQARRPHQDRIVLRLTLGGNVFDASGHVEPVHAFFQAWLNVQAGAQDIRAQTAKLKASTAKLEQAVENDSGE